MDALSVTGRSSLQTNLQNTHDTVSDLALWRAKIVKRLPEGDRVKPSVKTLFALSNDLFVHDSTLQACYQPPSPKALYERLAKLSDECGVCILHRGGNLIAHPLAECGDPELNNNGFFFFSTKKPSSPYLVPRSNLVFYFCQDQMLEVAEQFARLVSKGDFFAEIKECKIASAGRYGCHTTPAIIYLNTLRPSCLLMKYLDNYLGPIPRVPMILRGGAEIQKGSWLTQMLPLVSGCQPDSRRQIVLLSMYTSPPVSDPDIRRHEVAIKRAADILGYQSDRPDMLAEKTAAFQSLMFFTHQTLVPLLDKLDRSDSAPRMLITAGLIPIDVGLPDDEACEKAITAIKKVEHVSVYPIAGESLHNVIEWKEGVMAVHSPAGSKIPDHYDSCLSIGVKPESLHKVLAAFDNESLPAELKALQWSLVLAPVWAHEQLAAPVLLHAACSTEKLHEIAVWLQQHLTDADFSDIDLYRQTHPEGWADIPGNERHGKGLSIAQNRQGAGTDKDPFTDHLGILNYVLHDLQDQLSEIPLSDVLANQLFLNGYRMHDPAKVRPDLSVPEASEILSNNRF